ncbi:DNA polymerase III subunit gamma/tau [Streptococcus sp. CSL10205-OR2]|uniref:DNA polymerase III subunit gamma/tau n=1 Tax=Streptococcus sp. CSL10205-OR2 TaxID=2980558 RepID=UPI0021DA535F|nr:DNA polymerase III subunit gamma/tau [Streptococcus sp. CSL10205-OR2]MCU9533928.1 DNA polymerase III subunit gamma/tau [Streptococcus sp. CSL10205-OR2]
MYQALYRKYRSQTFSEMVGQEIISKTLKQAVATKKISHAYLFSGPRGTGKTSAAKIFAKAINCPNQVDGEPCNHCDICKDITAGQLEDVIEIDAASNNGVDDIRDIRDKSTYAPSRATYKVYIIDEVHMLSTGAFNALLKTLEEPTENVVFILATTELHKIPATILSRVQRFEFRAISLVAIKEHLAFVLKKEEMTYDDEALTIIANRAEGGMRDALSILDQARSLSGDNHISVGIVEDITGSIALSALDNYVHHVINHQTLEALDSLNTIFSSGKNMSRFAIDLLNYLRELLIVKSGGSSTYDSSYFNDNQQLSQDYILDLISIVTASLSEIKTGGHPKIYAETMTVRLSEFKEVAHNVDEGLLQELQTLKEEINSLKAQLSSLSQSSSNQITTKTIKTTRTVALKIDKSKVLTIMEETVQDSQKSREYLEALKSAWNEILDSISPQDRALLLGSEPVLANSENAILAFEAAFNAEQAMRRSDLNTVFGNIMSKVAGFSPNILAISKRDFEVIRTEFASKLKNNNTDDKEIAKKDDKQVIPDNFSFLADKIETVDDLSKD